MEFLNPFAFLFLLILPFFTLKSKRLKINPKIIIKSKFSNKKRFFILVISFVLLIFSLSRPVINEKSPIIVDNSKILVILDATYPMQCNDIYPNRFEASKNKLKKLLNKLKLNPVSVIILSDKPYLLSPYTTNYKAIIYLLNHINKNTLFRRNISPLEINDNAIVISFSYKRYGEISEIVAKRSCFNEKIGDGIRFTYSDKDIEEILSKIDRLSKGNKIKIYQQKELFYYFLVAGIILFFIALFL